LTIVRFRPDVLPPKLLPLLPGLRLPWRRPRRGCRLHRSSFGILFAAPSQAL